MMRLSVGIAAFSRSRCGAYCSWQISTAISQNLANQTMSSIGSRALSGT